MSDSTPLIHLARIRELKLLRQVFGRIFVPPAVHREVVDQGVGRSGVEEIRSATGDWIEVGRSPDAASAELLVQSLKLQLGEIESILLAQSASAGVVLMDEQLAVDYARKCGLKVVRTAALLIVAKREAYIESVRPRLDALRRSGSWLADRDYDAVLKLAGET